MVSLNQTWSKGVKEGLYREDFDPDIIAKLYVAKTLLVVDQEIFPLREYNKESLFEAFIEYHIRGIASAKGLEEAGAISIKTNKEIEYYITIHFR